MPAPYTPIFNLVVYVNLQIGREVCVFKIISCNLCGATISICPIENYWCREMLDKTAKKIKAIFYLYLFSSLVLDYFFTFTQLKIFISISYFS